MNLIIKKKSFDINKVLLVNKKFSTKLLYRIDDICILGIPFSIKKYGYIFDDNFLHIKLVEDEDILLFKKIGEFLTKKINTNNLINHNNTIKVKNNYNYSKKDIENKELFISISSIKDINNQKKIH